MLWVVLGNWFHLGLIMWPSPRFGHSSFGVYCEPLMRAFILLLEIKLLISSGFFLWLIFRSRVRYFRFYFDGFDVVCSSWSLNSSWFVIDRLLDLGISSFSVSFWFMIMNLMFGAAIEIKWKGFIWVLSEITRSFWIIQVFDDQDKLNSFEGF